MKKRALSVVVAVLGAVAACVAHPQESSSETTTSNANDGTPQDASAPIPETKPLESGETPRTGWLPAHQGADGRWGDSATTGIVLLTFLGAGETHQSGSRRPLVKKGLDALCAGQDADGCVAEPTSPRRLRDHAIAGLALVETYGMTASRIYKPSARRAVDFALKTRTPSGAWNFTRTHADQIDVETTVWMAMLLKSARLSALDEDPAVLGEIAAALDRITDPSTGQIVVPPNSPATFSSDAATAAALVVRVFSGRRGTTDALTAKAADALVAHPPAAESTDLPYVYFSGLAMLALGGDRFRAWLPGLNAFSQAQVQRRDGPERGSWDPPPGEPEVSRIWATAYHQLCAEFYYGHIGHALMRR